VSARSYAPASDLRRELQAAREIAHAFLNARRPAEVYRLALGRVAPLVGASFGCVFLRDRDPDLLRVVAAYNWPQAYATYLSAMRVRVGNGPTGRAVGENQLIEAPDVFADSDLADWWEGAKELGFTSSVSIPLSPQSHPMGAVTFYFRERGTFDDADRNLLRLVADQLAATAEKAHLIDDLERANEQLRAQNFELEARWREADEAKRVKSEFLANVSHELRTPLTAILGYSYLLREGLAGSMQPDQLDAVTKIESAGNVLMAVIDDLLDLSHLKLGRTAVQTEPCDAAALARAALASVRPPGPGVELRTESVAEVVPVRTDPVLVLRILQSLLANAVKFTARGSITVRIDMERPAPLPFPEERAGRPAYVLWKVEDTGIGIAPADQQAIFDDFRQVDGSATRRFGGAGLGLALSQGLARRLGGEIRLHSVPGEGSVFTLALPAFEPIPGCPASPTALRES
jgi:signal transduction histidine kinase